MTGFFSTRQLFWFYLIAIVVAAAFHEQIKVAISACGLAAIASLYGWILNLKHLKIIADTPTSTIASAAQGYVELKGIPSPKPEYVVVAKSGLPCIWYRCISYRKDKNNNDWREVERVCSDSIFEINDNSGEPCMVDPEFAQVLTSNQRVWYSDEYKHVEEQLFAGQPLYVLGEFSTLGADVAQSDTNTDVSLLLAEWKKHPAELLKRFDSNGDGKIDMQEWEQARLAARQEVNRQNRLVQQQPAIHMMVRPKNGRLFLISNLSEQKLSGLSRIWAWGFLLLFFMTLLGGYVLLISPNLITY